MRRLSPLHPRWRSRRLWLPLAALLTFGLALAGLRAARWDGAKGISAPSGGALAPALTPRPYEHPIAQVYSLLLSSQVAASGEKPLADIELEGNLAIQRAAIEDPGLWQLSFQGRFTRLQGQATALDSAAVLQHALQQPWRMRLDSEARVVDVHVVLGSPPLISQLWKSVAYSLQFVPASPPALAWSSEERDTVGSYLAEYQVVGGDADDQGPWLVRKTKLRYVELDSVTSALQPEYHIEEAQLSFSFDRQARFEGLEHTEKLWVDGLAGLPAFSASTRLRLVATPIALTELGPAQLEFESALSAASGSAAFGPARLSGFSWNDALSRLYDLASTPAPDEAQQKLAGRAYIALTEHLREDPAKVSLAERGVREGGPLVQTWIEALRDADTPESQAALVRLSREPALGKAPRMLVVRALSLVATATPTTLAALQRLQSEPGVGRQAVYGVGSSIYRLRESQPDLASSAAAELVRELERTEDPARQAELLIALGNAGHPNVLGPVRARLNHPSERVRAAALQALRRVRDPEADRLLSDGLRDPDARVRRSALDAFVDRAPRPETVRALQALLQAEREPGIRGQALNLALRWRSAAPPLAEELEHVAKHDPLPTLRARAQSALESH